MPDEGCLHAEFLAQSPACHWIIDASLVFQKIFGDPTPIFHKSAKELTGSTLAGVLPPEAATVWSSRFQRGLAGDILSLRERHGDHTWNVSIFPIRVDGAVVYAGGSAGENTTWTKAERELRYTVLGALKAQEYERNMLSKFLHDSVGQNLTAFGLQLDLIRMDLESVSPDLCARIVETQRVLEEMMEKVREYSYELNPSTVERAGLRPALDRLAGRVRERFPGALRLNVDPSLKLDKKIASALYQIAQEAVENAVQHSSCSAIEIAVKSTRTSTFLEVKDNGKGFDSGDILGNCRGLGLLSMEHYAAQAGLELSITSAPESGTIVRATSEV